MKYFINLENWDCGDIVHNIDSAQSDLKMVDGSSLKNVISVSIFNGNGQTPQWRWRRYSEYNGVVVFVIVVVAFVLLLVTSFTLIVLDINDSAEIWSLATFPYVSRMSCHPATDCVRVGLSSYDILC